MVERSKSSSVPKKKPIDMWLYIVALAAGIVFYLLPKTPTVVIVCLFLLFFLLVHPIWNFWWIEELLLRRILAIIIFLFVLGCLGYFSWPRQAKSESSNLGPDSIFIECAHASLPKRPPPDGKIWLFSPHPDGTSFGVMTYPQDSDIVWIPAAIAYAYSCQVFNYGTVPIIDVFMEFPITFREVTVEINENVTRFHQGSIRTSRLDHINIHKIDPGASNASIFYIYHETDLDLVIFPPKTATFSLIDGKKETRTVPVISGKFLEKTGMHFLPKPR